MAEPKFTLGTGTLLLRATPIQVDGEATIEDTAADLAGSRQSLDLGRSVSSGSRQRAAAPTTILASPESSALTTPRGWELGWIQLQLSEVNWAYYEGREPKDGSVLFRYDREPARSTGPCRDASAEGLIWYRGAFDGETDVSVCTTTGRESLPFRMLAIHGDAPSAEFDLMVNNRTANATNRLVECELHLRFCTVLTLRKPGGGADSTYQFLKHFEWSAGGRYQVTHPANASGLPTARLLGRHHCVVSDGRDGPPKTSDHVRLLTDIRAPHCLSLASLAPQRVRPAESATRTGPPRHG